MNDAMRVKICKGQGYIVTQVDLKVVGQRLLGMLEETREAFIH